MLILSVLSLIIWLYLFFAHGNFWKEKPQGFPLAAPLTTPDIAIVVPARDEAAVINTTMLSLLRQDYTGPYKIFLVDDNSTDETGKIALDAAEKLYQMARLKVVPAPDLPDGWVGKVAAMQAGYRAVKQNMPQAEYILFTDADIMHGPASLRELVARAEKDQLTLASYMVRLNRQSFWEKLLIPAFVFFFMMLYPFRWVRDPKKKIAAAAGGAMLVRTSALDAIGGFEPMRDALIDDCTLAKHMKKQGPIWLGLSQDTISIRPYRGLGDIWRMITRSAYTQLNYSPLLLALSTLGMLLTFVAPMITSFVMDVNVQIVSMIAWMLMTIAYVPTIRTYHMNLLWTQMLPFAALIYLLATLDSARLHYMGRGGAWKGRVKK